MTPQNKRLADVAVVTMGTSPKGHTYNELGEGIPLLNGPTEFGPSFPTCTLYTTDSKRNALPGDLIFCVRGSTTGRMNWADKVYSLGRGVCSIRGTTRLDTKYIRFCIDHRLDALLRLAGGATFPSLTQDSIRDFPVPYSESRHKIASILSAYDDLIENNSRRIALLEATAQAIYREWFVEFRFPGCEKAKLVDSPLGKIPEGWKNLLLSQVADVNALSIKKGKEPEEVNYVDIASVSTGRIDEVRLLPFSEAPGRARRILRHGDIIWSTVRPNRKSYSLILKPLENMIASTGFAVVSGTRAPFTFLYQALTTEEFVGYLVNHATGSAYPAVNSGDFEKAILLVPPQDILAAFDDATKEMFLLKHNLQDKNRHLRQTRDLLLPKLISGQLDVETLDIDAGETADL